MNFWSPKTLRSLVLPGGIFLLAASVVFRGAFGTIPAAAVVFSFYAVFAAGMLLAWRFHSSRILFALATLFLGHRALEFFSSGRIASAGPGRIALEAVAFLLPLNFVAFSVFRERGLVFPAILPRLALLFFESVFVAIICRPGETIAPGFLHPRFLGHFSGTPLPTLAVLAFAAAFGTLLVRFLLYRQPTESGLLWALMAAFLSFQAGAVGPAATAYAATAGLILISSIIENSYFLAYHDELTTLPARRAFNDALFHLEEPYAVAVVDIDHFKKIQRHLRPRDRRPGLAHGGGQTRRRHRRGPRLSRGRRGIFHPVSGEDGQRRDASPGAAALRNRSFHFPRARRTGAPPRSGSERQAGRQVRQSRARILAARIFAARTGEALNAGPRRAVLPRPEGQPGTARLSDGTPSTEISVTVSIGVAEPKARIRAVEDVIQAADQALYRAKQSGRNRVEFCVHRSRGQAQAQHRLKRKLVCDDQPDDPRELGNRREDIRAAGPVRRSNSQPPYAAHPTEAGRCRPPHRETRASRICHPASAGPASRSLRISSCPSLYASACPGQAM